MDKGFQKIDIDKKQKVISNPDKNKRNFRIAKISGLIILIVAGLFFVLTATLYYPGKELYLASQKTFVISKDAYSALKKQDIEESTVKFKEVKVNLKNISNSLSKLSWIKYIPLINVYYKDTTHFVTAGIAGVDAIIISTETISPYSDLLGFKGKSSFVSGSADERIKTAVETLDKIIPNIDKISDKISIVKNELDAVDINRYPKKIGSYSIQGNLENVKSLFNETAALFLEARPLLKKIPDLLGNRESKKYLLLFQNDAELRATGGFITAYAIFKIDKGKIQIDKADDIYKLDESKKKKFSAPDAILKYHKNVNFLELRDSNLSPDYLISMQEFEKMIKDSIPDFPNFDGIVAIDTHVFVSSIEILGDFNIYGRNFTAEKDPRCDNCPKAIYELEDYSTKPVAYLREERKDIIGVLMYQIMQRAFGVSPSKYWGKLFQMFINEAKNKHVLFYFHDNDAQKGIEALNFGGRILPSEEDYLHINDVNFAGAKSNLFVKHYVNQDILIGNDGAITKVLTLKYENPSPASNCNLEAGQLCLNGILRNWLRIYVPKGSKLIEFTGSEKDTQTYEDLNKTVFEGFFTVKPQGSSIVIIKYSLPFKYLSGNLYKLLIQKQPGTENYNYTVLNNGKEKENFLFQTDKKLEYKF